ncbi:hypothetical protein QBC98_006948 [Kitasatospora acidiphila]
MTLYQKSPARTSWHNLHSPPEHHRQNASCFDCVTTGIPPHHPSANRPRTPVDRLTQNPGTILFSELPDMQKSHHPGMEKPHRPGLPSRPINCRPRVCAAGGCWWWARSLAGLWASCRRVLLLLDGASVRRRAPPGAQGAGVGRRVGAVGGAGGVGTTRPVKAGAIEDAAVGLRRLPAPDGLSGEQRRVWWLARETAEEAMRRAAVSRLDPAGWLQRRLRDRRRGMTGARGRFSSAWSGPVVAGAVAWSRSGGAWRGGAARLGVGRWLVRCRWCRCGLVGRAGSWGAGVVLGPVRWSGLCRANGSPVAVARSVPAALPGGGR